MYITRDEAIVTLHDLMNSGILDADLCDELYEKYKIKASD